MNTSHRHRHQHHITSHRSLFCTPCIESIKLRPASLEFHAADALRAPIYLSSRTPLAKTTKIRNNAEPLNNSLLHATNLSSPSLVVTCCHLIGCIILPRRLMIEAVLCSHQKGCCPFYKRMNSKRH